MKCLFYLSTTTFNQYVVVGKLPFFLNILVQKSTDALLVQSWWHFCVVFLLFVFCIRHSSSLVVTVSIYSGSLCLSVLHIRCFFSFGVLHHINVQQSVELHEFHIQSSRVCSLYVVLLDERMGWGTTTQHLCCCWWQVLHTHIVNVDSDQYFCSASLPFFLSHTFLGISTGHSPT